MRKLLFILVTLCVAAGPATKPATAPASAARIAEAIKRNELAIGMTLKQANEAMKPFGEAVLVGVTEKEQVYQWTVHFKDEGGPPPAVAYTLWAKFRSDKIVSHGRR